MIITSLQEAVDAISKLDCKISEASLKLSNRLVYGLECIDEASTEDNLLMLSSLKWALEQHILYMNTGGLYCGPPPNPFNMSCYPKGCELPDCLHNQICSIICCDCELEEPNPIEETDCLISISDNTSKEEDCELPDDAVTIIMIR